MFSCLLWLGVGSLCAPCPASMVALGPDPVRRQALPCAVPLRFQVACCCPLERGSPAVPLVLPGRWCGG
jgi:hypothetical protein